MAFYVLTLRSSNGMTIVDGINQLHLNADTEADAIAVANSFSDKDCNVWSAALIEIIGSTDDFVGYSMRVTLQPSGIVVTSVPDGSEEGIDYNNNEDAGGSGYTVNDILTLTGGTFSRAAQVKVTSVSGGVVTGVVQHDPGLYSELPPNPTATTGGTGTGCTMSINPATQNSGLSLETMLATLITDLNAHPSISGASIDMGPAGFFSDPEITVADAGDNLGDQTMVVEWVLNNQGLTGWIETLTHEGVAAAALTLTLDAPPVQFAPKVNYTNLGPTRP